MKTWTLRGRRKLRPAMVGMLLLGLVMSAMLPVFALPGSSFESTDGNLTIDTAGNTDWINAPNFSRKADASARQGETDDSYKGGAKHDQPCPEASTGSIPPEKDDLLELYVSHETIGSDVYLYLGWERFLNKESSASAHMGFEFNHSSTACPAATKSANVLRTEDDILILYDLEGGGTPVLNMLTWLTTLGPGDSCKAAAAAPCWGNEVNLTAAGFADGGIQTVAPITDPIASRTLGFTHMFGEAAINLTDAGVFDPGICENFGTAMLGSRSSGNSFTSTLKDFVGPLGISITNCGSLKINKVDENGDPLSGAKFKVYKDDGDGTFEPGTGDVQVGSECTTSSDGTGTCTFANLFIGDSFWVHETAAPPGYEIDPSSTNPRLVTITSISVHTVTFTNRPALGDLKIVKKDDAGALMNGVKFTLSGTSTAGGAVSLDCTALRRPVRMGMGCPWRRDRKPGSGASRRIGAPLGAARRPADRLRRGRVRDSETGETASSAAGGRPPRAADRAVGHRHRHPLRRPVLRFRERAQSGPHRSYAGALTDTLSAWIYRVLDPG